MKYLLEKIICGEYFTEAEAILFIEAIDKSLLTDEQIAGVLVGIQMRSLQLSEVKGFRKALLSLSTTVPLPPNEAMDLCGTGGDGKDTFNISTTTALVLAAMGKKIIKHGNYGVSSLSGSSNVLEALGFKFTSDPAQLEKDYQQLNLAILHAPMFHPTMKKAAPIRKQLGIKTLFNALGPLVNPAQPHFQMTGTFSLELARIYQHVLRPERKRFKVVHGMDGYDELSLTDSTRIFSQSGDDVRTATSFQLSTLSPLELHGGTSIAAAAAIVRDIIRGKGTSAQTDLIAANVAEALHCFDDGVHLESAFEESQQFILSGQTAKHFNIN